MTVTPGQKLVNDQQAVLDLKYQPTLLERLGALSSKCTVVKYTAGMDVRCCDIPTTPAAKISS